MSERYITILGAEMHNAAEEMRLALTQHQRFMDDWLQRFTAAIEAQSALFKIEPHDGS